MTLNEDISYSENKNESRSQNATLKSQFVISSLEDAENEMVSVEYGGSRYLSFAFTEREI